MSVNHSAGFIIINIIIKDHPAIFELNFYYVYLTFS